MENEKLYTGVGDKGYTRTLASIHVSKCDPQIELLGTLDEFTSNLGAAKPWLHDEMLLSDIEAVQRRLIEISGEIAGGKPTVTRECARVLEEMIDKYQQTTGKFDGFILPGATKASAQLDIARTVIRRAERVAVKVNQIRRLRPETMVYLNRLCDLIYAFARYADHIETQGGKVVETVPSGNAPVGNGLTLALAKEVAFAVEQEAENMELSVVIAVLDAGANLMLLQAMDDAYIASRQIAQDKAYTALSLKMPTETALAESRGGALDGLSATSSNRLMLLGGGMPLKIYGTIVGGLGVSGGTADEDIHLAQYGARYLEGRMR